MLRFGSRRRGLACSELWGGRAFPRGFPSRAFGRFDVAASGRLGSWCRAGGGRIRLRILPFLRLLLLRLLRRIRFRRRRPFRSRTCGLRSRPISGRSPPGRFLPCSCPRSWGARSRRVSCWRISGLFLPFSASSGAMWRRRRSRWFESAFVRAWWWRRKCRLRRASWSLCCGW